MAKGDKLNPYLLLVLSVLLLGAGFLMKSFPVLVFTGIAPLFALADHAGDKSFLKRLGKVPLILFWLTLEYIALEFNGDFSLANALVAKSEWLRWTKYTGVSGASLWILLANLFLYFGLFRKWPHTVVFVIVIVGPILYSYTLPSEAMTKPENGEWVARTSAWISVLVLLSAVVKELIRKK